MNSENDREVSQVLSADIQSSTKGFSKLPNRVAARSLSGMALPPCRKKFSHMVSNSFTMQGEISPSDMVGGFLHLLCETVASLRFGISVRDAFGLVSGVESSEENTDVGIDRGEQGGDGGFPASVSGVLFRGGSGDGEGSDGESGGSEDGNSDSDDG